MERYTFLKNARSAETQVNVKTPMHALTLTVFPMSCYYNKKP